MVISEFHKIDSKELVDCAMGRKFADLVIRNCQWVCVQTGEIISDTDIAVLGKRIAFVGEDASHTIGPKTHVIEAQGKFASPGLIDGHMHVESGMLTVTEFVRAVLPRGTTGMFIDPHEIANVFNLDGVKLMADEAVLQPIHVFVQIPSCVPSAPQFETVPKELGADDVAEAINLPQIIGLGEVMNYPAVQNSDTSIHEKMNITRNAGKVIGGHYPSEDLGIPFNGYAAGGAQDDHEATSVEGAITRARQGMRVMMRYGSGWHDVEELSKALTEYDLDSSRFILCTDDSHSHTLVFEGHMDRVINHAIEQGIDPMTAVQMASINPAEYFGLGRHIGMIAPGRYADIVLVEDMFDFKADLVIGRGQILAENGALKCELPQIDYPEWALNSIHIPEKITPKDFYLPIELDDPVKANVIGIIENQAPTQHLVMNVKSDDGFFTCDLEQDIIKVAVIERHQNTGRIQLGLVHGFGFSTECAVASTVAHDCHHMIIVGTDDEQMALAANKLIEMGGGQIVVNNNEVIGAVHLPIAGLMSNCPAKEVAEDAETVLKGFEACGCKLNNPNMQLSLMALVVIPDLRISDLGLVDVNKFEFIPLFVN
ncbi:MAG: adenine deaminase [Anaerolineaceae bacterium]|nr:adenine deaminase [Anaerolineaceae bacterium]